MLSWITIRGCYVMGARNRILMALACLLVSTGPGLAETMNGVRLGRYGFFGTPISSLGIEGDVRGERFRFTAQDQYPGFRTADRFGLDISAFSLAYYHTGRGTYISLNPGTLVLAAIVGFSSAPDSGKARSLTYWGAGPYATAMLLPQLLTNWSLRLDLVRRKLGVSAGPATDVLAGRYIWVRCELQSGVFLNVYGAALKGVVAYDAIENRNRYYLRVAKVFEY